MVIKLQPDTVSNIQGEASSGQSIVAIIQNVGGSSAEIAEIASSCGCTRIGKLESTKVTPGQEVKLELSATPPELGTQRVKITVNYDGPLRQSADAELVLSGRKLEAPIALNVTPPELFLSVRAIGEVKNEQIEVTTNEYRNSAPWITSLVSSHSAIKINSEPRMTETHLDDSVVQRHYQFTVGACLTSPETVFTEMKWKLRPAPQNSSHLSPTPIKTTLRLVPTVVAVPSRIQCSEKELSDVGKIIHLHSDDNISFSLLESNDASDL